MTAISMVFIAAGPCSRLDFSAILYTVSSARQYQKKWVLLLANKLSLILISVLSLYLVAVILVPAAISAPGIISLTPITTVLVDGNVIVVLVGFWIAISVIMPACPPGCEATSTW